MPLINKSLPGHGLQCFPSRKQANISANSELAVSLRFNKAITRDSQNTFQCTGTAVEEIFPHA